MFKIILGLLCVIAGIAILLSSFAHYGMLIGLPLAVFGFLFIWLGYRGKGDAEDKKDMKVGSAIMSVIFLVIIILGFLIYVFMIKPKT